MKRKDKIIKEGRARVGNDLSDKELESNELFFPEQACFDTFCGKFSGHSLEYLRQQILLSLEFVFSPLYRGYPGLEY